MKKKYIDEQHVRIPYLDEHYLILSENTIAERLVTRVYNVQCILTRISFSFNYNCCQIGEKKWMGMDSVIAIQCNAVPFVKNIILYLQFYRKVRTKANKKTLCNSFWNWITVRLTSVQVTCCWLKSCQNWMQKETRKRFTNKNQDFVTS